MVTTNATVPWVNQISYRGMQALQEGEDVYEAWNFRRIFRTIQRIKEDQNLPRIDESSLYEIDVEVLKDTLLFKSSWHHVNDGEKTWFYRLDEKMIAMMDQNDVEDMIKESRIRHSILNCPRLVRVKTYQWVRSANDQHDTTHCWEGFGVLYNGEVYFYDGLHLPVRHDQCQILRRYNHVPKGRREVYDDIRRDMRKNGIYC